jgi:hypothetical protein
MELVKAILVLSMACQTASFIVISIMGQETPKLIRIFGWISSTIVIIALSFFIAYVDSDRYRNRPCPEYRKIEVPVYELLDLSYL